MSEISPNDVVGKVLGKEHSGRVRCLGLRVVPSRAFKQTRPRYSDLNAASYNNSYSSQCQEKYNLMMNAHTQLVNAFKTYMIMKEGTIPEQFAGIFVSPTHSTPSDAASGSISPIVSDYYYYYYYYYFGTNIFLLISFLYLDVILE